MRAIASRLYSGLRKKEPGDLFSSRSILSKKPVKDVHPKAPVRTRFAPSPTGLLHIGSLRTALYNYLLARNTGGQFLLRLEDTDQKRLVPGAEQNIYDSLKWCGIDYDEGPNVNDMKCGPFRQSERTSIYQKYVDGLLESGHAYRCFCSKERLDGLRESAKRLKPPTTTSYDRACADLSQKEIDDNLAKRTPFTIRMRAPDRYPPFKDLLHGVVDIQPQVNINDRRYDDPILVKSDNLPTYHFANVIDDHLMKITHVIRGEEWLPSTQKHIALYQAFGWEPPSFIHIPLLTSANDKKLSKRKGDASVLNMKENGILPEALVNFCVLFGWSPPRKLATANHECFTLKEFERIFNLNYLTKGNAKVDDKKLWFFNKHYLQSRLADPSQFEIIAQEVCSNIRPVFGDAVTLDKIKVILKKCGTALTTLNEFKDTFSYFFQRPTYTNSKAASEFLETHNKEDTLRVLEHFQDAISQSNIEELIRELASQASISKKAIFESLRFALAESHPGTKIPVLIELLGPEEANVRISRAIGRIQAPTSRL
ncbi:hypothetical protein HG536_0F03660 [Torulaspora globosa]|uniref:Glutamate--tRNA ligase, mitochondrial n=1 Tax=Torulaspora globosa TaxID=48254 RepID=A0A7G3ZKK5_9SACH|nr:uncharacterized protein HG536_0F03660 [Torulaspora globosa]QLL34041.1 hypothetical protein HG536_0F03660 [Torulaspora globosa]